MRDTPEGGEKDDKQEAPATTETPVKQTTKLKKKKVGKKGGKLSKPEGEAILEVPQVPQESPVESEELLEGERPAKADKKHKKEKGKTKEKVIKKKKKITVPSAEEPELSPELTEEPTNLTEESGVTSSETLGEVTQPSEEEPISKVAKKRRHPGVPEGDETKAKGGDKPPKKKKKKKHQPEVVVQPWADLEGEEDETTVEKSENIERQDSDKDGQFVQAKENDDKKSSDEKDETQDAAKVKEPLEVFSDWSDDSQIGDETWSDINEPEVSEDKPKIDDNGGETVASPNSPAYDDVYDPISDDELDAMLGDEDEEGGARVSDAKGTASAPMAVEEVDWSALVSAQSSLEKTGTGVCNNFINIFIIMVQRSSGPIVWG